MVMNKKITTNIVSVIFVGEKLSMALRKMILPEPNVQDVSLKKI